MSVLAQTGGDSLLRLLVFGGAALGVFALIYVLHRFRTKKNTFNITFARLYGLLVLAILATGLAFADIKGETLTAAFTLLGTIAGYLAGARPSEAAVRQEEDSSPIKGYQTESVL